ncbi:hypothetical protein HELRODRAFT_178429 [Helobdella robusta]|uniref:C2H2-type domain-containing protein n=1 Tax=Helobdella robusta TaxID=6412 RepID=T1FD53_HELRO|nr:hypothetical protein HELRODRAFT_178429 [Helobdella robusta]ESN96994.1 hypothetical protein HELRODRAFT_178429 [Helobdella robusta]
MDGNLIVTKKRLQKQCMADGCGFLGCTNHHMKYHMLTKHGIGEKLKCPTCEYTCANRSMLNSHLKKHSVDKPFLCETCGSSYKFAKNPGKPSKKNCEIKIEKDVTVCDTSAQNGECSSNF